MTASLAAPAPPSTKIDHSRLAAVGLVGGALALTVGRLLTFPGGSPAERLQQADGHPARITAELVLVVLGLAFLVGGFLAVAGRIHRRGRRTAAAGAVLCLISVGVVAQVSLDAVCAAAAAVGNREVMVSFVEELDQSMPLLVLNPIATIGYFFGPFLVTLAARRAGMVGRWLPWGVLISLPLQFVGESLRGPVFANVADAVLQLVLVVMVAVLARHTLLVDGEVGAAGGAA